MTMPLSMTPNLVLQRQCICIRMSCPLSSQLTQVLNTIDRLAVTKRQINALTLKLLRRISKLVYRTLVAACRSGPIDVLRLFWLCVALLFNAPAISGEKIAGVAIKHHYFPFGKAIDLCLLLRLARRRPDLAPWLSFRFFKGERVGRRGSNLRIGGRTSCGACHCRNVRRVDRLA